MGRITSLMLPSPALSFSRKQRVETDPRGVDFGVGELGTVC